MLVLSVHLYLVLQMMGVMMQIHPTADVVLELGGGKNIVTPMVDTDLSIVPEKSELNVKDFTPWRVILTVHVILSILR